jgi:hypothetical protein
MQLYLIITFTVAFSIDWLFGQEKQFLTQKLEREGPSILVFLKPNCPSNVPPLRLKNMALYGFWPTTMDTNGGRWFCVEKSRPVKIYFDSDGDNRLDDETPRIMSYDWDECVVKVKLHYNNKEITYFLNVCFYEGGYKDSYCSFSACSIYEGIVNFDGVKRKVRLIDGNANAKFNDFYCVTNVPDTIGIFGDDNKVTTVVVGKYLRLNNKVFNLKIADDGSWISVWPDTNIVIGSLKVNNELRQICFLGENGQFLLGPEDGLVSLPVGDYNMSYFDLEKEANGIKWIAHFGNIKRLVKVEKERTNSLETPIVIYAYLKFVKNGSDFSFTTVLTNECSRSILFYRNDGELSPPKLIISTLDGKKSWTNLFSYG